MSYQQRSHATSPKDLSGASVPNIWSIVVAAGQGSRFGAAKQLQLLGGKRLLDWSVEAFAGRGPVVVVGPMGVDPEAYFAAGRSDGLRSKVARFVSGGESRSASVRAGLEAVDGSASHLLIHDAARPMVSGAIIDRVVAALSAGADGVIPVVPIVDSLRTVGGQQVDRSGLVAVQTPQGFTTDALRAAHAGGGIATDDATLVSEAGGEVVHVSGDVDNLKITVPRDLTVARAILSVSQAEEQERDLRNGEGRDE